jgi:hypothetical protein
MRGFYFLLMLTVASPAICQVALAGETTADITIIEKRDNYSLYKDFAIANANNAIAAAQLDEMYARQARMRAEYEAKAVSNPSLDLRQGNQSSRSRRYCSGRTSISFYKPSTWFVFERPDVPSWNDDYAVVGLVRLYDDNTIITMHVGTYCNIDETKHNEELSSFQKRRRASFEKGKLNFQLSNDSTIQAIYPNASATPELIPGDRIIEYFNLTDDTVYVDKWGKPGDKIALKVLRGTDEIYSITTLDKKEFVSGEITVDSMNGYFTATGEYIEKFGEFQHLTVVNNVLYDKERSINWVISFEIRAPDDGATFEYNWKRFRPMVVALVESFDIK